MSKLKDYTFPRLQNNTNLRLDKEYLCLSLGNWQILKCYPSPSGHTLKYIDHLSTWSKEYNVNDFEAVFLIPNHITIAKENPTSSF